MLLIDEGRMVIALPGAYVNVDPRVATDAYGEQILRMTRASLVRRDDAGRRTGPCAYGVLPGKVTTLEESRHGE